MELKAKLTQVELTVRRKDNECSTSEDKVWRANIAPTKGYLIKFFHV